MIKKIAIPPGSSLSNEYLANRDQAPIVSHQMVKSVSDYRKGLLQDEVSGGIFRDGSNSNRNENSTSSAGLVTYSIGQKKTAQVLSSSFNGGSGSFQGGGGTVRQIPEVYSPLWLTSNLSLPRDRATINAWLRAFFALNPFVHNAINLHSTYPISKLNIKCADKKVEKFFNDMIEEIGLMNICVQVAMEYWLLGEAFIYATLDPNKGKWASLQIQNPDYMVVNRTIIADEPVIMMRPDENLKRIISSNRPSDIEQKKQLNPYIIDAVKRGENIPMNNFNISHLSRKINPYEIRGTGLPVCIFRQLMLFDQLRESKFAQAQNMINPTTIVKIGTDSQDGLHPTHADLEGWRDVFAAAQNDRDFKIFTHAGINVERVGWGQGIYDISGDVTQLIKEIYIGLMAPQVLMDGGADTTYANGGVALDVLRQRYMQFRNYLTSWLKRKIFAPISELQGFWTYKDKQKQLIVPEIDWNHMSLFDAGDYTANLITLTQPLAEGESPRVSKHTLYRSLGLEWDDEMRKLRKESIQNIINQKEKEALNSMSLNTLRTISEDEEIKEPIEDSNQKDQAVPGEMGTGGDLGSPNDAGAGSLPPLPPVPPPTSLPPSK